MNRFFLFICLVSLSCSNNGGKNNAADSLVLIDSTHPVGTNKKILERYDPAYTDTFTINRSAFRIRRTAVENGGFFLEKKEKDWVMIDTFLTRQYFYNLDDFNKDGYKDLLADRKWQQLVYLFDPVANTFVKTGFFSSAEEPPHIVSVKDSIFFDRWESKWDNWWSYLYTIHHNTRYNLAILEYRYAFDDVTDGKHKKEYLSLRQIENDTTQIKIKEIKKAVFTHFNLDAFWKASFTRFYPNKKMKPNFNMTPVYQPY